MHILPLGWSVWNNPWRAVREYFHICVENSPLLPSHCVIWNYRCGIQMWGGVRAPCVPQVGGQIPPRFWRLQKKLFFKILFLLLTCLGWYRKNFWENKVDVVGKGSRPKWSENVREPRLLGIFITRASFRDTRESFHEFLFIKSTLDCVKYMSKHFILIQAPLRWWIYHDVGYECE